MRTGGVKVTQAEAENEQLRTKGRQKLRRGYATNLTLRKHSSAVATHRI
jgi:hypothetical protein